MPEGNKRLDFLLHMYDQLFNDINTHILVVWQSIGVLIGAFAIFALAEKNIVPVDVACSLILLIVAWLIGHLYDASYWYNRNLAMIANIERQFLQSSDLRDIHYYFGKHRQKGAMITHLRVQYWLALGIGAIVIIFHLSTRIFPLLDTAACSPILALPYLVLVIAAVGLALLRRSCARKYEEFLSNSPGIEVDTTGISYGPGHKTAPDSPPAGRGN